VDDYYHCHHYQERTHDTIDEEEMPVFEAKQELDADPLSFNIDCANPSKFFD